jgi:hypothetical protein
MKTFTLIRKEDVSGVSGTGTIAEGCEFKDGQIVLSWLGSYHSVEIHPNMATLMAIHGHNGKTLVEWDVP